MSTCIRCLSLNPVPLEFFFAVLASFCALYKGEKRVYATQHHACNHRTHRRTPDVYVTTLSEQIKLEVVTNHSLSLCFDCVFSEPKIPDLPTHHTFCVVYTF